MGGSTLDATGHNERDWYQRTRTQNATHHKMRQGGWLGAAMGNAADFPEADNVLAADEGE